MKITVNAKNFSEAINWATKTLDLKDNKAYVNLTVEDDNTINLSHINQVSYVKSPCLVEKIVKEDLDNLDTDSVSLAMEAIFIKKLSTVIASSGNIDLIISDDKKSLKIKSSNSNFNVPLLNVRVPKEPSLIELGEVDDREFFESLQHLSKLCDPNPPDSNISIGSVYLHMDIEKKKIILMGTDRYSLGEIIMDFDPSDEAKEYSEANENIFIPQERAMLVAPSKGLTSTTTLVHEKVGQKFGYVFGDGRIILFSLTVAEALNYSKIKENALKVSTNSIEVNLNDLKKAINNISNLAWTEPNIYLDLEEDNITVKDKNSSNIIKVDVSNAQLDESCKVAFVRSIINESFIPLNTNTIKIKWLDNRKGFIFTPVTEDGVEVEKIFVLVIPTK